MKSWNFTQKLCLALGVLFLIHSIGGMVVNPDFGVGDAATSKVWLWMDWNGWHALSGIALWSTAIVVSPRPDWARLFAFVAIAVDLPIVFWMLVDPKPLGLFILPTAADFLFHSATVIIFALAIYVDRHSTTEHPIRSYP